MEVDRYSPFEMKEQEEILFDAVNRAMEKSPDQPGTKGFATRLAKALAVELGARCKEP